VRLRLAEVRSLLEFVRGLYAVRDVNGFVDYALSAIPAVVPSDLTVYGDLDPPHGRFHIVSKPANIVTPALQRAFDASVLEHPFTRHYLGGGDGSARKISDLLTRSQFHRLALYNDFFRAVDIENEMVVWLPALRPRQIIFAVHRRRQDFSERDRRLLNLLRAHLIQAYQNADAVSLLKQAASSSGQATLFLDDQGRIEQPDDRALKLLADYFGWKAWRGDRLPEPLREWVSPQERLLVPHDASLPREPLVIDRPGTRLIVRQPSQRLLLFEERPTAVDPRLQALSLTHREGEVLAWVAQGKTNDAIATLLGLSYRTVEKHLENILRKLGVETRTAAAARAFEIMGRPAAVGADP
jgi:DNA-binding CsgD family transcriptional regulator